MLKAPPRRRVDTRRPDAADPATPPSTSPTGPAGGDLGGTYPNPTVVGLSHVTAGGSLSGTMDAPTVNSIAGIAAGGDLSGTYPNPTVTSLANATVGPAVYPAGSAANLTDVPTPPTLKSGLGTLDGSGFLDLSAIVTSGYIVGMFSNFGPVGSLVFSPMPYGIVSSAGAADAGKAVSWIAF